MEWLDEFVEEHGVLKAVIATANGNRQLDDLGTLSQVGLPTGDYEWRAPFTTDFSTWEVVSTESYLDALDGLQPSTLKHQIFRFRHGRSTFLVPALALVRGLFPLIPDAFSYAFSLKPLSLLCHPIERNGHWSVAMPDFHGVYRGRFRPPTLESLTWASIYPSAHRMWLSIHQSCRTGNMAVSLPSAKVRLLPFGIRRDGTVFVTSLVVSGVLAEESPFEFAKGAATAFQWNRTGTPLGPHVNRFFEQALGTQALAHQLTDEEWEVLKELCVPPPKATGRRPRDEPRLVAEGLLTRAMTGNLWRDISRAPLTPQTLEQHWYQWRRDGRLHELVQGLRRLRPDDISLRDCKF